MKNVGNTNLKSLIIHEENTKEINTETEFGYVMKHLDKIKPTFISIFSLNTDLFEMLHFLEFGYPDETLFLVFDLLLLCHLSKGFLANLASCYTSNFT